MALHRSVRPALGIRNLSNLATLEWKVGDQEKSWRKCRWLGKYRFVRDQRLSGTVGMVPKVLSVNFPSFVGS
jgi:hypothetical protein